MIVVISYMELSIVFKESFFHLTMNRIP